MTWAGQAELFTAEVVSGVDPAGAPAARAPWLEAVLEADLAWRRSAVARLAPCGRCGVLVFHAADLALDLMTESTVDPRVLDRGLEVAALLAGRYTAELEVNRHGGGPFIHRRDRWTAPTEPAVRGRFWVPEHKCFDPLGHELPLECFYPFESRTIGEQNDPPF